MDKIFVVRPSWSLVTISVHEVCATLREHLAVNAHTTLRANFVNVSLRLRTRTTITPHNLCGEPLLLRHIKYDR